MQLNKEQREDFYANSVAKALFDFRQAQPNFNGEGLERTIAHRLERLAEPKLSNDTENNPLFKFIDSIIAIPVLKTILEKYDAALASASDSIFAPLGLTRGQAVDPYIKAISQDLIERKTFANHEDGGQLDDWLLYADMRDGSSDNPVIHMNLPMTQVEAQQFLDDHAATAEDLPPREWEDF